MTNRERAQELLIHVIRAGETPVGAIERALDDATADVARERDELRARLAKFESVAEGARLFVPTFKAAHVDCKCSRCVVARALAALDDDARAK